MTYASLPVLAVAALFAAARPAPAQDADVPHGWGVTFEQAGQAVIVHAPAAALALRDGESAHPLLGAADLKAAYAAQVRIERRGRYRFGVEVEGGAAQLSVTTLAREPLGGCEATGGLALSEWIELPRGEVELVLSYQRAAAGQTRLRSLWEMELAGGAGFVLEPIPSAAARVWPSLRAGVERGLREREGRVLLERKGCTNCHAPPARAAHALGRRPAPRLAGAGARPSPEWLARWIHRPADVRPGADMPALFGSRAADRAASDALAHYLASLANLAAPAVEAREPAAAELEAGRALYHRAGCIACHGALESAAALRGDALLSAALPETPARAPFGDLAGKWSASALAEMLVDPRAVHPDGRMPAMGLERGEAQLVAGYLAARWGPAPEPFVPDPERAARGREVLVASGCHACHELPAELPPPPPAPALDGLDPHRGCLDASDARTPRYELSDGERVRMVEALRALERATGAPAPLDRSARRIDDLGCASCHSWDGAGGPGEDLRPYFVTALEADLGDEGRIPPDLSGVGFKLHTRWLEEVLQRGGAARPYMAARMPQFGAEALRGLADGLAARVGLWPHSDVEAPPPSDEMVLTGRRLMGRDAMACVSCHVYADHPPAGTPGADMTAFAARLRYEWFRSFVLDPARYEPGTRMPAFGAGGRSNFPDFYDGDMLRQADAMWAYFGLGEFMPPPEGLSSAAGLQLAVGERPRVVRTFLEGAGSRGIAVGFPLGVHYSFDATAVRVVEAWKGDFLDASGAWAGRGGNVAGGRGPRVWTALEGPPFVIGARPASWPTATGREAGYRFRGYRLESRGAPMWLYEIDGVEVLELVLPSLGERVLSRSYSLRGLPAGRDVWVRAREGDRVTETVMIEVESEVRGVPNDDGTVWYRLQPGVGGLQFVVEARL